MPKLSCVVTCKSRLAHLQQSLPRLMATPDCEVVVVDYDCPQGAATWVQEAFPAARVIKVEDRPTFNLAAARNLGGQVAAAPWLLFLDADSLVEGDLLAALEPLMTPGGYGLAERRTGDLWGALLVSRQDYADIGGYDEALQGWGSEDEDITARLAETGLAERTFPAGLLHAIPHDSALRTLHYDLKDPIANNWVNHLYLLVKRDLARLDVAPGLESRQGVYAQVRVAALNPAATSVDVTYRRRAVGGRLITSILRYQLSDPP